MAWRTSSTRKNVAVIVRRQAVRNDLLNGLTNQIALAARYGISQQSIGNDISVILGDMREENKQVAKAELLIALSRMEDNYKEASKAWRKSKRNKEEVVTDRVKKVCVACRGTGMRNADPDTEEWCPLCNGDGFIIQEKITRRVTGQAGDPSFLKERRELIKFRCFLLGIPDKSPDEKPIININFANISNDKILKALSAIEQLREEKIKAEAINVQFEAGAPS